MKTLNKLLLLLLLPTAGMAQSIPGNDFERLRFLADSFAQVAATQKAEAIAWARANNQPIRTVAPDGTEIEIMRLENGRPVYFATDNDDAALSTNTNDLWNGGALGLNLEGQSMFIGEWDGGAVRATHQEFDNGSGSRVTQGDSPSSTSWHATHVAGTLMAEGQVSSAKGMAPQADLHAYDWNSDNSEMSTEAAGGLLISNHSYGTICGWYFNSPDWYWYGDPSVSSTEDYNFGRYNNDARAWDLIAEAAPYYLICKSAGNDRNDNHVGSHEVWSGGSWTTSTATRDPDGGTDGYDCVGPAGTAKNILTVAAVGDVTPGYSQPSDVSMSSFSGWGPTDDGRIKPDISGNGIGLYSCDSGNDANYTNSSGTSMSSPNVAGSLTLLQQHYNNLNGSYMRSSTLKALVIHTANEAGSNNGPDYEFGWGLLDAAGAAEAISNTADNTILEPTLTNGNTWSLTFTSNGIDPFSATMSWIDPAAAAQGAVLNPTTSRLTNDLDIRISDGGAGVWFPWTLDPANPSSAATNGDNFRDNVEKLEPGVLPAGTYTLLVTHKGTLSGGSQPFSVIVTGVPSVPIADFNASSTTICSGETVTLNNASSGSPTTYSWSITPATGWTYVNGTNASSVSPQIQFTGSGSFTVSLTATNALGSNVETKSNYINIGGLSLPFSEDFESTATQDQWTVENPDGSITWSFQSVGGNGGSTAAGVDNFSYSAANNNPLFDHLISPPLNLTAYNTAQMTFEYAYVRYGNGYEDSLSIWISADCGSSWTRVASYEDDPSGSYVTGPDNPSEFVPNTADDWCNGNGSPSCPTVNLSAWAGFADVRIRFTNISGYGNNLYVDNINITGTTSASLSTSTSQTNVTCSGGSDGSASVTVSGGVSPYTFSWSNGIVTGGPITTHNVDVGSFFYNPSSFNINSGDTIVWTQSSGAHNVNGSQATFPNNPESFFNGSAAGGTWSYKRGFTTPGSYNYHCDPHSSFMSGSFTVLAVSNNSSIANLSAGGYSCTITDANGLTTTVTYSISQPSPLSTSEVLTNPSSFGASDGQISVTASGGTAPYQFDWSTGTSNNTNPSVESGLADGTYQLTITDANGCTFEDSYSLTQPPPSALTSTSSFSNNPCNGDANASASISVSGGVPPYSYSWTNGGTASAQSNLVAGLYGVTATDQLGTTTSVSFTLIDPAVLLAVASATNESVAGGMDGTAGVTASGGTAPYSYLWSNGVQTAHLSALSAGSYSVTVTDAQNCMEVSQVVVLAGATPLSIAQNTSDVSCFGDSDGSIDITVSGGTGPFNYLWSNGAIVEDLVGIASGNYSLTISDSGGQSATTSAIVNQPTAIQIMTIAVDESIAGASDGSIGTTVSGGTPPYTYLWSTGSNAPTLSNLSPAIYGLTVTDANTCKSQVQVTVQPGVPLLNSTGNSADVSCFGGQDGSITLSISGGVLPYSFIWNDGSAIQDRSSLSAGSYSVTISDQSGQSVGLSFTLSQPPILSTSIVAADETIAGAMDGSVATSVSGGTAPYSYEWNTGNTMPFMNSLAPGVYAVTVTDANACKAIATATVGPGVALLQVNGQASDVLCSGGTTGSIALSVSGGSVPYSYIWNDGSNSAQRTNLNSGSYTVTVTDQSGQSASFSTAVNEPSALVVLATSTNESIVGASDGTTTANVSGGTPPYQFLWNTGSVNPGLSGLMPGSYSVTVTDANNCMATASATVATGVSTLTPTVTSQDVTCFGAQDGSIDVVVSGGQTPYSFAWADGSTSEDRTLLAAGQYSVTVSDASGQHVSVMATVSEPSVLAVSATTTNESIVGALDGTATVNATGGTPPYQYLWNTGAVSSSLSGLGPGTYAVTLTDTNGCTAVATGIVAPGIPVLAASVTVLDVNCFGNANGSIDVAVSGGQTPYSFAWADGSTSEDRTLLAAGQYSVTVNDASGQHVSVIATVSEPALLVMSAVGIDESVAGASDGSASASVSGGSPPYSYLWSNGAATAQALQLSPGSYTLTVTDINGCSATATISIANGASILGLSGVVAHVSCFGGFDGSIDVTPNNAQPPLSYLWSDGASTEDRIGLAAGSYSVTATDALNQTASADFIITEPTPLLISLTSTDESIAGFADGTAQVSASGGTPPYSFSWSNGQSSAAVIQLIPGTYGVTAADANGCTISGSITVNVGIPTLTVSGLPTDALCAGSADGSIDLTTSGGSMPYQYQWADGLTSEDRVQLNAGSYSVTVTDASGQTASASFLINDPTALSVTVNITDETVVGAADGSASAVGLGGTPAYHYLWSTGATGASIVGLAPGIYGVTVTDNNGCTTTGSGTVSTGAPVLSASGSTLHNLCFGGSNGAIDVTVSGGQPPIVTVWNDGVLTEDRVNLAAGNYSVTISDGAGQNVPLSFTITQPMQLTLTISHTDETMAGAADGTASSTVSGGTPPYTFAWSNGETTAGVANLAAGQYALTITDAYGCTVNSGATVAAGPSPLSLAMSMTEITCFGDIGTATVSASGGMPPYSYSWSTGATSATTDAPLVAQYSVTVTDAQGWTEQGDIIVTGAEFPTQVIVDLSDTCLSTITLQVIGGAAPYQFDWIDLNDPTNNPTGPTITLANACADAVCLSAACVITDANGCVFETDTIEFVGCLSSREELVVRASVYPNPGTRSVTIESSEPMKHLTIANTLGEVMYSAEESGVLNTRVNTEQWPNGTYFIRATIGDRPWTYRWIKTD